MARQIVVEITGNSQGFTRATEEASSAGGKFGGAMSGLAAGLGLGVFNAAMGAISGLTSSVMDSADKFRKDQVSIAEMSNTLKNTIPGWTGNTQAIEAYVAKQAALGFGAKDVRDSIAQLSGVTHSVAEAQRDEAMAQELARSKGLDLATATDIITKAHEGNAKALKGLGIQVTTVTAHVDALKASHGKHTTEELKAAAAADKQETSMNALKAIMENTKGAAEAYANTSEGKLAAAQAKNEASWVKIGAIVDRFQAVILPLVADAFSHVADAIGPLVDKVQDFMKHSDLARPIMIGLAAALGILAVIILAAVIPAMIATVVAALPLILIIAAIGVVVAAVAYAWEHNMFGIRDKAKVVVDWVKENFPKVVAFVEGIGTAAKNLWTTVSTNFGNIVAFVKGLPGKISSAATGMWDGIQSAFKGMLNTIIGWWNGLHFSTPAVDFLGQHVASQTFRVPQIPYFEKGGVMPYTGLAYLHRGETVTPAGRGGGEVHIHIGNFIGSGSDIDRLADLIGRRLFLQRGLS